MILTVNDLPSNGVLGSAPVLGFRPLKFLEVLDYTNYVVDSPIKKILRDLKFLVTLDRNIIYHSLYDLDYLVFMMKVHTISSNLEFNSTCKCRKCNTESVLALSLEDIKFNDLTENTKLPKYVVLGGVKYRIKIPTIETFISVLDKYNLYQKVTDIDVIKLISLFPDFATMPNEIEDAIFNANRDDIAVLSFLETNMLVSVKPVVKECKICKDERGMAVRIESLIASMFREILLNNEPSPDKIQFE